MRAGDLREKVALQKPTDTADGQGGFTRAWTHVAFVWGRFDTRRDMEGFEGNRILAMTTTTCVIRYRSDVRSDWRLFQSSTSTTWEILNVRDIRTRRHWLELTLRDVEAA